MVRVHTLSLALGHISSQAFLSPWPSSPTHPFPPQAAGLGTALSDRSLRATLFAPTDRAFALLLAGLDVSAEDLLARPELLQKVRGWGGVG